MASAVQQLPDDLIYHNILPRLPFRSLTRLAAVCRAWRRIILLDDAFAALQAQTPSSASVAVARYLRGSLRILTPDSADVAPPDRYLSFVEADHRRLAFCACTGGVVCLVERRYDPQDLPWLIRDMWRVAIAFFVVNPATREFHRVPYDGDVVTAGLAYDPQTAPREGFQLVVPVAEEEDGGRCRFWRFTSRRGFWSPSPEAAVALPPLDEFKPKPVYAGGRMHWLAGATIVWYDFTDDRAGTMPLLAAAGSAMECDHGSEDLSAWRGRLRLARVNTLGVWVYELADGAVAAAPARWETVHSGLWEQVPGLICPGTSWPGVRWSLGTVEMEAGGEEAVCVVVAMERRDGDDPTKPASSSWRGLLRYDVRTGAALAVLELDAEEEMGPLVDYHSSMAKLPLIRLALGNHAAGPGTKWIIERALTGIL